MSEITYEILVRSRSDARAYQQAVDQIIELDQSIFAYKHAQNYDASHVFNDFHDDDNVVTLMKSDGVLMGYGFAKLIRIEHGGQQINVFQACSGMLPEYVGSNKAMMVGLKTCLHILKLCKGPTYTASFLCNPGFYRKLTAIFQKVYPSPDYHAIDSVESCILNKAIETWGMRGARNQSGIFLFQDIPLVHTRMFSPRCASDEFFLAQNSDYVLGHYLGFCARISFWRVIRAMMITMVATKSFGISRQTSGISFWSGLLRKSPTDK